MLRWLAPLVLLLAALSAPAPASANAVSLGPHFGFNFDVDDPFLGLGMRFDVGPLASTVMVQLNPSFSYYFTDNVDLFNFSFNVPFEFVIRGSSMRPFAAPGLGIWHWSYDNRSDTDLALNLLGGLLIELPAVEPFVQLRVALADNSFAELMGGVLFVL